MKYVFLITIMVLNVIRCTASCDTVYNLKANRGVPDSFTIYVGWDADANAIGYQAFVGRNNPIPKSSGSSFLTSDSMVLNSAMPDSTYTICVRAVCGAGDTSGWICRSVQMPSRPTTNVNKYVANANAVIYPNPASNRILFRLPSSITSASITIRDIQGQILLKQEVNNNSSINVIAFAKGIYFVTIQSGQYLKVEKLQIE